MPELLRGAFDPEGDALVVLATESLADGCQLEDFNADIAAECAAACAEPATRAVLDKYCVTCHNQRLKTAGLTLDTLDLARVAGSGAGGRVLRVDVERALGRTARAPEVARSRAQRTAAERLTASKRDVPHFYLWAECDLGALAELRALLARRDDPRRYSWNDFALRAAALALRDVPEVNASFADGVLRRHEEIDALPRRDVAAQPDRRAGSGRRGEQTPGDGRETRRRIGAGARVRAEARRPRGPRGRFAHHDGGAPGPGRGGQEPHGVARRHDHEGMRVDGRSRRGAQRAGGPWLQLAGKPAKSKSAARRR